MLQTIVRFLAPACAGTVLMLAGPAAAECMKGPFKVKLPEQRLDERLQQLAHVTGCFMEVEPALLADRGAPRLSGRLTTAEALRRTLRGSGLEAAPVKGHWRIDRRQQAHFAARAAALRTTLQTPSPGGRTIAPRQAEGLADTLARVDRGVPRRVQRQGYLSVAQRLRYDAMLNGVAKRLGQPVTPLSTGWIAPVR